MYIGLWNCYDRSFLASLRFVSSVGFVLIPAGSAAQRTGFWDCMCRSCGLMS